MKVNVGDTVTCAETGLAFIAERQGCTFNYAYDSQGYILSDAGVDIREKRELLDRSQPFSCYLASDGKTVTGWKGNTLGTVTSWSEVKLPQWSHTHGKTIRAIRVTDIHGGKWHGRSSPGIAITLRAYGAKHSKSV